MSDINPERSTQVARNANLPIGSHAFGRHRQVITVTRVAATLPRSLAVLLLFGLPIAAQSPGVPIMPSDPGRNATHFPQQSSPYDPPAAMQAKRITALNQMRHKEMVSDAGRLLLLAQELNAASANLSTADRMHKAAEIEKLAKSVRDKMSYVVGDESHPNNYTSVLP